MVRKTVGLYKRYSFSIAHDIWAFYFKRPLYWVGHKIPVIMLPSDLVSDFPEFVDFNGCEWEVTLKRSPTDKKGLFFTTRACPGINYPGQDPYIFPIPSEIHSVLKSEGFDKEWCVLVLPYDSTKWNTDTRSKGVLYSLNMEYCAKIHSEHANNIINGGYYMGDLFDWLYSNPSNDGRLNRKVEYDNDRLLKSLRKHYDNVEFIEVGYDPCQPKLKPKNTTCRIS